MSEMVVAGGSGVALSGSYVAGNSGSGVAPKRNNGRPFTKGDPRINRHGRPRTSDQLKKLVIKIMGEEVSGATPDGVVTMSRAELLIRDWIASRNFQKQNEALKRGFGEIKPDNDVLLHYDLSNLNTNQLQRLSKGEDLITVLLTPNK